jgi:hypothetical protein
LDREAREWLSAADEVIDESAERASQLRDAGFDHPLPPSSGAALAGLQHPLSARFAPAGGPIDFGRARLERSIGSRVMPGFGHGDLGTIEFVRAVSEHLGPTNAFRTDQIATDPDREGRHIVFPGPERIAPQLRSLDAFLAREQRSARAFRAIVAMLVILNCHPLRDGNGRTSRIAFNRIVRPGTQAFGYYLPLYEIGILARGGFVIRMRQAELHGDWTPIAEYVLEAARFWSRHLRERTASIALLAD